MIENSIHDIFWELFSVGFSFLEVKEAFRILYGALVSFFLIHWTEAIFVRFYYQKKIFNLCNNLYAIETRHRSVVAKFLFL